eukprot:CAMPEP_0202947108 /NCGR_PEP_ID=MMETSP1395-20130829/10723_1 /ASSEMBLY_ACC=CAM_ASM_000871 /TAXON_ID=5961 /ORGANISM="Blepharisma japonicum, Strain Stock R1072" /LENGTH=217 /DNA_ID=CAMNT_0049648133 /DNA_START=59 /DNA_END=712 /DNA_ORIENTATION=+
MTAMEIRFDTSQTIASLKNNLSVRFGTAAEYMMLKLFNENGEVVANMSDNDAQLGTYNPHDFYVIHIIDLDPSTVNIDNLEEVPKYQISDEAYNQRDDTFRKFKEQQQKLHPDLVKPNKAPVDEEFQREFIEGIQVGNRCKINPGDKRGTVRYVGKIPEAQPGYWVGIELDEPLGKNDGCVKETRYFQTEKNHGIFVRPNSVEIGNFRPYGEDPDEL